MVFTNNKARSNAFWQSDIPSFLALLPCWGCHGIIKVWNQEFAVSRMHFVCVWEQEDAIQTQKPVLRHPHPPSPGHQGLELNNLSSSHDQSPQNDLHHDSGSCNAQESAPEKQTYMFVCFSPPQWHNGQYFDSSYSKEEEERTFTGYNTS